MSTKAKTTLTIPRPDDWPNSPETVATALAVRRVRSCVSVSFPVALLIASHAGLGPQAVR